MDIPSGAQVVAIRGEGRLTVPADLRSALDLKEGTHVLVQLDRERGGLFIQPVDVLPRDPSWVQKPGVQDALDRGFDELAHEKGVHMSEELVEKLRPQ